MEMVSKTDKEKAALRFKDRIAKEVRTNRTLRNDIARVCTKCKRHIVRAWKLTRGKPALAVAIALPRLCPNCRAVFAHDGSKYKIGETK